MTDTEETKITPIAIVGCGGRFPGDASNPDLLWEILMDAKSTLSDTPKDRFNADAFYHPQPSRPGSQNFKAAHFMNRVIDAFDAPFFSITPSEAKAMDPQQRMCLEVAYEAMENEMNMQLSNLQMISLEGKSKTFDAKADGYGRGEGTCFVVVKSLEKAIEDNDVIRAVICNTGSNQDGNTPGLTLPSRSMQEALIRKVYDEVGLNMEETGYFEAHKTKGTGTVAGDSTETRALGETIGKSRLPGQPLWVGSIKANIGHLEGASGLAALIKTIYVLEKGIIPPQIWYEDTNPRIRLKEWNLAVPTEVTQWPYPGPRRASVNSFGFAGANAHAILEDAASYLKRSGKTGRHISKAAEQSSHSPTRSQVSDDSGFSSVDDEISNVKAFPKLVVWSAHEQGGLNRISDSWKEYLSMKTSMYSQPEQYRLLRDLAYTASKKRTQFPWRSFAVCSNPEELATGQVDIAPPVRTSQKPKLAFVFTGQGAQHYAMGRRLMAYDAYAESLRAADKYLDSLGCPWSLVQELLRDAESSRINPAEFSQPLCIAVQVALVDLLRSLGVWPPGLVIGHSGGETAAAYAKGALTRESAWKVAYHRGRVCSIVPDANPELELDGDMLAAGISEETAKEYIKDVKDVHGGELVVACVNSPTSVTFSGDVPVIIEAEKLIKADGHLAKRLGVNRAYHSGHMKVVADMYHDLLKDVKGLPETPDSPKMYSCVTGELIDNADLGGEYWVTNLLNQVKFSQAMTGLITHSNNRRAKQNRGYCSVNIMLEVGPHGALQGPVKQNLKAADAQCTTISVLDRKKDAAQSLLEAMGVLFQHGYQSDIAAANCPDSNDIPKPLVDLPPYPWNHSNRYWHESAVASSYRFKKFPRKDLLGLRDNEDNDNHPRWRHFLRLSENPWMEDHQVQGKVIYPAAGMLAMALEASREIADADRAVENFELRDVLIKAAIMIPSGEEGVETMLHMHPRASAGQDTGLARKEFSIYSRQAHNPWTLNCTGLVRIQYKFDASTEWFVDETKEASAMYRSGYQRARQNCRQSIRTDAFYSEQSELGLEFGGTFQNVEDIHTSGREMVCAVRTPNVRQHMPHGFTHDHLIHPCTLDPIVHSCLAILNGGEFEKGASVPISIGRMMVSANVSAEPGTIFSVHSTAEPYGLRDGEVTIKASTTEWESPQIMFDQLRITRLGGGKSKNEGSDGMRKIASKIHWDVDVSYLKAMRHTSHNSPKEIGEAVGSLESFVRLLGHKHPDLKVLEVGAGTGEITETLLNALKGRDDESTPWLQLYRAATENAEDVKSLEKISNAWGPYLRAMQLETNRSWEEQALQPQDFDCIIIRANVESNDTDALLEKARSFLKDQGSLIILPSELFADSQDSWDQQLRKHNFTGIDYAVIEEYSSVQSLPFLVSSPDTGPGRIPDEVLIVGPSHPGPLFESLKQQLQPHGVEPVYTTLCHTQGMDLSTKHCVITSDLERPILFDISAKNFLLLKRLLLESQSILWVTSGATIECREPKASLVTGLVRSINQEHPELSLTTLDVDPSRNDNEGDANIIIQLLQRAAAGDTDHEFSVRDGLLQIPRIRLDRELNHYSSVLRDGPRPEPGPLQQQGRNLALRLGVPGNVDSVYFMDNPPTQSPLAADDVEIEVKATGLSALDLQSAIDQARDPAFGYECSGVIKDVGSNVADFTPGNRVMTWCTGAFANTVRSPACLVQRMLIGMSFETAAALPINYCTAYQALVECARLVDGEKVLVHSAASGVGQAAIMIAQNLGAEVYVTVGSEAKRSHLMETYGLQEDHVFYSRGVDFLHGILRVTQSVGVDVVVNCLSGESVRHSGACLAPFGRFIEIGQKHSEHTDLGALATRNLSYHVVDINGLRNANPNRASKLFKKAMGFCLEKGCQPASPLQVKGFSEIADGLRLLRGGNQMGKVVFKATGSETVMAIPPPIKPIEFLSDASYIIVGGFGGLGQHIAKWMAGNGARHLIFLSRSGGNRLEAKKLIADIEAQGANVTAYQCDISNFEQVQQVMNEITADGRPPVRGVVQAAMSLADATFRQMTPKQWELSTNTKARGTWNIHLTTPRDLDFFIMLSSVSGIIGLRGQANYAAGNTFLDALARHRRAQGMAAMAIDVGAVFDVGYMAEKSDMKEMMRNLGFIGLTGAELVGILQTGIGNGDVHDPDSAQVILGLASGGYLAAEGIDMPYYFSDSKMAHLKRIGATGEGEGASGPGLSEQLGKATNRAAAAEAVSEALRARLAKQMMVDVDDVDGSKPVSGYGVDSLTAVDIRAWTMKEAQADISILDIVNNSSIMSLAETIVGNSKIMANKNLEE
ncbi:hypothetical protein ATERTT37_007890 [Aspergillus terreus]